MQQVDHYLKQAKAARELASTAGTAAARIQFESIAEGWERLAQERLSFLQSKLGGVNGDAMDGAMQHMLESDSIRLDR